MTHPHNEPPLNPLPPVVIALFLVIVGLEVFFTLGARGLVGGPEAVGWRLGTLERFAFSAEIFAWMREGRALAGRACDALFLVPVSYMPALRMLCSQGSCCSRLARWWVKQWAALPCC